MLQQLIAAGAVHPRPEDEAFLRDAFGMPAVDIKLLQQEQDDRKARAPVPGQPPTPGQPPVPGQPPTERPAGEIGPRRVAASRHAHNRPHQLAAMADGAPDPAVPGQTSYRTREYAGGSRASCGRRSSRATSTSRRLASRARCRTS
jgi:hypothetical protein